MNLQTNGNETIGIALIVEDNQVDQEVLCTMLRKSGFITVTCQRSEDARKVIDMHPLSIVFIDVVMHQSSGFEILQQLRNTHQFDNIPIIMMSTYMRNKKAVFKAINLGAQDYLVKPISQNVLVTKLHKHLFEEMSLQRRD